jgi:hypothetical protein
MSWRTCSWAKALILIRYLYSRCPRWVLAAVDLVKQMQPGGNLQDTWMMFDHVKRVKKWTTMACHVYDSTYCRIMTIAVCNMQSEDVAAQNGPS